MFTKDFNHNYANNMVYSNSNLTKLLIDGGYITFGVGGIPVYHFYQNDHLGNVRVVSGANGTVEEVNHYYPYGALMGESQNTTTQPYKYNRAAAASICLFIIIVILSVGLFYIMRDKDAAKMEKLRKQALKKGRV